MKRNVICDTGPLVAFLNKRDQHHDWAVEQFKHIAAPLATCESVMSEASFLLTPTGKHFVLHDLFERGVIEISFRLSDHFARVQRLLKKYASVPMSLADGCLVCMSELTEDSTVFTLDHDFLIYRKRTRQTIPLITW